MVMIAKIFILVVGVVGGSKGARRERVGADVVVWVSCEL